MFLWYSINVKNESETSAQENKKETEKTKEPAPVTSDDVSDLENTDTYFEEMRATINMDRNQVISMLTDAETTADSSSEKESATQQKLKLLKYMEQEQNVENAIKTKKTTRMSGSDHR